MIIEDKIAFLKKHKAMPLFLTEAISNSSKYNALVNGEGFLSYLIEHIEKIESAQRAKARQRYSKDIRSLVSRIFSKRSNVFNAAGGSERFEIESETTMNKFIDKINSIKGDSSVKKYLSDNIFNLADVDPNGVIFMEYKAAEDKIYPTYKSTTIIRNYESNGQRLEWLILKVENPELTKNGGELLRIIDDFSDETYLVKGDSIELAMSFSHPFGAVPGFILSPLQKTGSELRKSFIDPILPDLENYARMKSIDTIYEIQKGSPKHWRLGNPKSETVNGVGNRGNEKTDGEARKTPDVTDISIVPIPREGDPNYLPNVAGYISPDIDYMEFARERRRIEEDKMIDTIWGTTVAQMTGSDKTATEVFVDVQPITNKLNDYSAYVQWCHDFICEMVGRYTLPFTWKSSMYKYTYGRRFIIESVDSLLKRYNEARQANAPTSILDDLLETVIIARYQNNSFMTSVELKKARIEPYKHFDIGTVSTIFGKPEAQKKAVFGYWWDTLTDAEIAGLDEKQLNDKFKLYANEYTTSLGA